ncbi:MAG: enoyl-CoA hydratase/isomerase family protein [Betaproteobacteria bacterium]|nr:enoyl-CoA hydratase/isomerase family protein [Betaproteobacteria bacterium]
MSSACVLLHTAANGVATLTFDRPDLHNAIDEATIAEFKAGLAKVAADPDVRVLVIAGNGKSFCAGADLNWMQRTADYDEAQNYRDALEFTELLAALDTMPKPTIARVHGPAYGGGVGIVAACDIALGTPQAAFMFSEVRLGLVPAMISPYAVAAIGERHARRYMLSAERIDAAEALRIGLLHEMCDAAELDARIGKLVEQMLRGGPESIARSKALVARVAHGPIDTAMKDYTARTIAAVRAGSEGKEGIAAFLEKRLPAWVRPNEGAKR